MAGALAMALAGCSRAPSSGAAPLELSMPVDIETFDPRYALDVANSLREFKEMIARFHDAGSDGDHRGQWS